MKGGLLLKGISKTFGREAVLSDLDLEAREGMITSVVGPSGCGKSTMLRIIAGLERQDRGEVWKGGKRIDGVPPHSRGVGMVFQHSALFPHRTAMGNVEFGLEIKGMGRQERNKAAAKAISMVGLSGMERKRPSELSGGQRQRVAIARALVVEPEVLLLDEPFSSLDQRVRRKLRRDFRKVQEELGLTAVFVTHDMEEAFEVGHFVCVMHEGRIEQSGTPIDLYESPATPFIAGFVAGTNAIALYDPGSGGSKEVLVRPEDMVLMEHNPGAGHHDLTGKIGACYYLGSRVECTVHLSSGATISAMVPSSEFVARGFVKGLTVDVNIAKSVLTVPESDRPAHGRARKVKEK